MTQAAAAETTSTTATTTARNPKPPEPKPPEIPARILRRRSAAHYSGTSTSYLDKLRVRGGGPRFVLLGAKIVGYDVRDLDEWLEERKRNSTSDRGAR